MTPDVGSLRAALDAHFSHSGDCDNTRFGRCTCNYYADRSALRAALAAEPVTPEPDLRPRTECVCGARILDENFANHLLRQDGKPHCALSEPAPSEREAQIDRRYSAQILVDGEIGSTLIVGTVYKVGEIRTHYEPSGVEGELGHATTIIRFDPVRVGSPEAQIDVAWLAKAIVAANGYEFAEDGELEASRVAAEYARLAVATPESR